MTKLRELFRIRTFSLRTGLVLFIVLGVGFGLAGRWIQDVRERGDAQLRLVQWRNGNRGNDLHVYAQYPAVEAPSQFTSIIRKYVHPEYRRHFESLKCNGASLNSEIARDAKLSFGVSTVYLGCSHVDSGDAASLFQTFGLKELFVQSYSSGELSLGVSLLQLKEAKELEKVTLYCFLPDRVGEVVRDLPRLKEISVSACTPECIALLASNRTLQKLHIGSIRHSEGDFRAVDQVEEEFRERSRRAMKQALQALGDNPNFRSLSIQGQIHVAAEDLKEFCRTSQVNSVNLQFPQIAPQCLEEFAKLGNLTSLCLYELSISDEHLASLYKAKKLKQLVIGPNVSADAILALREKLPNCKISRY